MYWKLSVVFYLDQHLTQVYVIFQCKLENFPKHIEENIASRISPPEGHTDATNAEKPATA